MTMADDHRPEERPSQSPTQPPYGGPGGPSGPSPPGQPPPGQYVTQPYGYEPPQPYGPPPVPYVAVPVPARTNGLAIASMVLGILWLYWIGSILALVFGYVSKKQIDESGGMEGGRGMAVAGIVLGWVGVGTLTLVIVGAVIAAVSTAS